MHFCLQQISINQLLKLCKAYMCLHVFLPDSEYSIQFQKRPASFDVLLKAHTNAQASIQSNTDSSSSLRCSGFKLHAQCYMQKLFHSQAFLVQGAKCFQLSMSNSKHDVLINDAKWYWPLVMYTAHKISTHLDPLSCPQQAHTVRGSS